MIQSKQLTKFRELSRHNCVGCFLKAVLLYRAPYSLYIYLLTGVKRHMSHLTRPSLFQIMACRLLGVKPLSEPMMANCYMDPLDNVFMRFKKNTKFSFKKIDLQMSSAKRWSFRLCLNTLTKIKELIANIEYLIWYLFTHLFPNFSGYATIRFGYGCVLAQHCFVSI